jgi:hypothetical protein
MKTLIALIALSAMTLSAADITGKWKSVTAGPNGPINRTFVFKQDGAKLTGQTTSDRWGKSSIENGKIDGDAFSFSINVIFEFGYVKVPVTGTVEGDVMKMAAEVSGTKFELSAKRVP